MRSNHKLSSQHSLQSFDSDRAATRTFPGLLARHQVGKLTTAICWGILLALIPMASGQRMIGVDICGCQPATYEFTFNFDQICDDSNVAGPGINETACLTEIRGRDEVPDEELVPVSVQSVQIFELDQIQQVRAYCVVGRFANSPCVFLGCQSNSQARYALSTIFSTLYLNLSLHR